MATATLIGAGVYQQYVRLPRQPVAWVGDTPILTADLHKAVRERRYRIAQQLLQLQSFAQFLGQDPSLMAQIEQLGIQLDPAYTPALGDEVIVQLIDDEHVRQEAARRGIVVTAEEVTAEIHKLFNYFPEGMPTPVPTATLSAASPPTATPPQATETPVATPGPTLTAFPTLTPLPSSTPVTAAGFQGLLDKYLADLEALTGMTEADFRSQTEIRLLRDKVRDALTADVPIEEEQRHLRHILVADEALAKSLFERANAGEDFAALAQEHSQDPGSREQGGDLGWIGPGETVRPFEEAAFGVPVGELAGPVLTQYGWHVIQVLESRTELRTPEELRQARQKAFDAWLSGQRVGAHVRFEEGWEENLPEGPTLEDVMKVHGANS